MAVLGPWGNWLWQSYAEIPGKSMHIGLYVCSWKRYTTPVLCIYMYRLFLPSELTHSVFIYFQISQSFHWLYSKSNISVLFLHWNAPSVSCSYNVFLFWQKWQRRFFVLYEHGCLRFALDESVSTAPLVSIAAILWNWDWSAPWLSGRL